MHKNMLWNCWSFVFVFLKINKPSKKKLQSIYTVGFNKYSYLCNIYIDNFPLKHIIDTFLHDSAKGAHDVSNIIYHALYDGFYCKQRCDPVQHNINT